jgi:ubiquinone/menaquinone biosynthesis C-methylase UbiE
VLKEWLRVLKPNGILRIAVPDMKSLFKVYEQTDDLSLILGPIFGRCNYLYNYHYTGFDFKSLKKMLELAGAKDIRYYDWRLTEHANIDDYSQAYIPQYKEHGILISLNVEATK